jgi:hypothetical protein
MMVRVIAHLIST